MEQRYKAQLSGYMNLFYLLEPGRRHRCGLFFPVLGRFHEIIMEWYNELDGYQANFSLQTIDFFYLD